MTEEVIIDLPVTETDDLESVTETEAPEEVAPENTQNKECSNISGIEDSGRIMFRGVDMLFLKVNGIQMFTFYEIMSKLCPDTKRGNKILFDDFICT